MRIPYLSLRVRLWLLVAFFVMLYTSSLLEPQLYSQHFVIDQVLYYAIPITFFLVVHDVRLHWVSEFILFLSGFSIIPLRLVARAVTQSSGALAFYKGYLLLLLLAFVMIVAWEFFIHLRNRADKKLNSLGVRVGLSGGFGVLTFIVGLFYTWSVMIPHAPENVAPTIEERAYDTVFALKYRDTTGLAQIVHPDKGVRFSPYAYVQIPENLVFTREQMPNLLEDTGTYLWGSYDGSGEPIEFTPSAYYDAFVYNHDFANAEQVSYDQPLGHGNSINNAREMYPGSTIVEYYFPGFDEQYEGMDWASLRLVFEQMNGTWYLVGIINDRWTI